MKVAEHKPASISQVQKKSETPFFDHESEQAQPFFAPQSEAGSATTDAFFQPATRPTIQAKLTVGQPNDKYEQEADHVADKVVQRLAKSDNINHQSPITNHQSAPSVSKASKPIIQHKAHAPEEEKLDRKEESKDELPELQKSPVSAVGDDEGLQMKCAACEGEEHDHVQKKGNNTEPASMGVASSNIETQLNSSKGGGSPLPDNTRSSMESAMGADFSNVRVHTGSNAVQMSQDLNAHAFTHGSDVYFNEGKYNPSGTEGGRLLAHELTHTVQQGGTQEQSHNTNQVQNKKIQREVTKNNDTDIVQTKLEVNSQHLFEGEVVSKELPSTGEQYSKGMEPSPNMGETETTGKSESSKEGNESSRENETTTTIESESATTAGTNSSTSSSGIIATATSPDSTNSSTSVPSSTTSSINNYSAPNMEGNGTATANVSPAARESTAPSPQGNSTANTPASSGCTPQCYKGQREEPAEEPEQTPTDPAPTQVEAEASKGDEEDLPELDNCPANTASAAAGTSGSTQTTAPQPTAPAGNGNGSGSATSTPEGIVSSANGATGALEESDQSLAGVITSAELQRGNAVSAYEQSLSSLRVNSGRTSALRRGIPFVARVGESQTKQGQRRLAASRAERFFSSIADKLDTAAAQALSDTPDQLGLTAESGKAQISASIETQKTSISARIGQARGQAVADAAMAKSEVRTQTASFVADVQSKAAAAIESLTTTHRKTMSKVDALETSTLNTVNSVYAQGRTDLEGLGTKIGAECTTKGETFATTYEGFSNCTENGFWDGDLSGRRAEAQANAAREVAKAYHDRMVEAANKRAREVTRNGRKADRCSIIAAASKSRDTLDGQLPGLINAFETTRDGAIQQARAKERQLLTSINSSLSATLRQLDQQERSQRQSVNDTGYMQQVLQEQIAYAAAAAVQKGVQTAITSVQDAMLDVQSRFASGNTPEISALEGALAQVEQKVSTAMDGLNASASTGTTRAENQLVGASQQAITSLEGITQSNDVSTATLSGGFSSSMSVIAGTDHFATQRTSITTQIKQSEKASVAALAQAFDGFKQSCETTLKGAHTALEEAHKSLELNLRQSKQGMECEMTHKADEAASKEAPAWKRVLAVVLVIIVIIIVIAVIIATAGAGLGILAAAAIGAGVGAVTSGLLYLASNLWSNQDITLKGLGKAVLIGAVTGFIGGGIGAAAGAGAGVLFQGATKAVQVAAQFGAAMISAGGVDVVTQYVMAGFSFKNFSWGQLGITFLVTAVTFGIGHAAGNRVGVPTVESPGGGGNVGGKASGTQSGEGVGHFDNVIPITQGRSGGGSSGTVSGETAQAPMFIVEGNTVRVVHPEEVPFLRLVEPVVPEPMVVPEPIRLPVQAPAPVPAPSAPSPMPAAVAVATGVAVGTATQPATQPETRPARRHGNQTCNNDVLDEFQRLKDAFGCHNLDGSFDCGSAVGKLRNGKRLKGSSVIGITRQSVINKIETAKRCQEIREQERRDCFNDSSLDTTDELIRNRRGHNQAIQDLINSARNCEELIRIADNLSASERGRLLPATW
jgi:Domain of unknown function (DUF4157)